MRCRIEFYYFLIIALVLPNIVCGWGYDAHRRVNWSAATIIPGAFGKYVRSNRQELTQYAVVAKRRPDTILTQIFMIIFRLIHCLDHLLILNPNMERMWWKNGDMVPGPSMRPAVE